MEGGEFQRTGAATLKALSPKVGLLLGGRFSGSETGSGPGEGQIGTEAPGHGGPCSREWEAQRWYRIWLDATEDARGSEVMGLVQVSTLAAEFSRYYSLSRALMGSPSWREWQWSILEERKAWIKLLATGSAVYRMSILPVSVKPVIPVYIPYHSIPYHAIQCHTILFIIGPPLFNFYKCKLTDVLADVDFAPFFTNIP